MNSVLLTGSIEHKYSSAVNGEPLVRLIIHNERGRFSAVAYGDVARKLLDLDSGAAIFVLGSLRQRRVNRHSMYEIVIKEFWAWGVGI